MKQKQNKKKKCAQFKVKSQKHRKNHVLYISHTRVNTQQAFAILRDLKTHVMVHFDIIGNTTPCNRFYILQHFFTIISSATFMMKIS